MKTLKESILGNVGLDDETLYGEDLKKCRKWIYDHYYASSLKLEITQDGIVANAKNVTIKEEFTNMRPFACPIEFSLTNGIFKWGTIKSMFNITGSYITSLEGCPKKCQIFKCILCYELLSLEGAPQDCEYFDCDGCKKLTSLKGAPKKCKKFWCGDLNSITTLEGAPIECEEIYCCRSKNLTSLKGAPKKAKYFTCDECTSLESLKYLPSNCIYLNCESCTSLKSLKYLPSNCTSLRCESCSNLKLTDDEIDRLKKQCETFKY